MTLFFANANEGHLTPRITLIKQKTMFINNLEKVSINHSDQWLLVRGNSNAPLILQVQAGPGLPMISEANSLQKLHHLEDDFLVAYWDQRGCGKSFHKNENLGSMNLSQLADDLIACIEYLLKKYDKETATIIGYSIGATISLFAAQKLPSLFHNLFVVGLDINVPLANNLMIEFLSDQARKRKNSKWLKQVNALKGVEINNARLFQKRAKLLSNAGGIRSGKNYNEIFLSAVRNMLLTREYKWADILSAIRGMEFSQNALLTEFNSLNLFQKIEAIQIPVHFMQGIKDAVAPHEIAVPYFQYIKCASKSFTEFEQSAHMPHLEEPDKFAKVVRAKINSTKPRSSLAVCYNQS
jgi:pimeloyl-ACP methyl ester carboxylesterase